MENYYEILEVNEKASNEIIQKVFKMQIKKYHPDLFQDDEKIKMEEKVKKINEAYDVLSDPDKRKIYDEELNFKKIDTSIDEEKENLIKENEFLKSLVEEKEAIISDFLDIAPSIGNSINRQNNYTNSFNNSFKNNFNNDNNTNISEDKNLNTNKSIFNYLFSPYLKTDKAFLFKFIFSTILIIIGLAFIGSITNTNIFLEIFKVFFNQQN